MVDYYLIARGRVHVDELYRENGIYRYQGGWHVKALVAAGIGILFSTLLPNFTHLLPAWWGLYGWFFGVAIGGASYWALRMLPEVDPQLARRT